MEFWGVEVKSGAPLTVKPGKGMIIHLSQASIGELKANKNECISLIVNVDGNKMVLGTLLSDKLPQQLFDLVFDRDFELSHNSKSGSVYFFGYKAENPVQEEGGEFDTDESEEEEEDLPLLPNLPNNGKPDVKAKEEKPKVAAAASTATGGKPKVKIVEPTKAEKSEDDDDSDDDDSEEDSDEDGTTAGDLKDEDDDSDSQDDDSDSEEDDDTPKKVAPSKKRDAESEIKTPVPGKKAKLATPQKTDGKKTPHVDTPHPSKPAGKTPANKASQQTPKSGGAHSCGSCNKAFGSENALQSHNKAKHTAGK